MHLIKLRCGTLCGDTYYGYICRVFTFVDQPNQFVSIDFNTGKVNVIHQFEFTEEWPTIYEMAYDRERKTCWALARGARDYATSDVYEINTTDGSGIENGIIRKYLTGIWGDEIDLSSSKSAEKSFSFTVDPKWNVNNMRVVAFINNYDSTNPLNCPVFNSAEMRLAGLTGIHTITSHGEYASVKLEGNRLVAGYGYHILGIFDLAGRQVAENNIGKGIYIVKLSNGRSNQTLKFYVR